MTPIDFRNATFESLRARLNVARSNVYEAWLTHGPCTTRQLAIASGIDLLTLRPRTTELYQLGLVTLAPDSQRESPSVALAKEGHEGIYIARTQPDWETWREFQHRPAETVQAQLI